ncbi:MAG: SPFH domain-containing protein [Deltaproteobacteria bacterium]|nr:SPFH domain-containing protein [Deltaproteobacteria bacterium]
MDQKKRFQLLQRARLKNILKKGTLFLIIGVLLYYGIALIYATKTIYKVRYNYAVVLEDLAGKRRVVDDVGWHLRPPFFSRLELEVPLMNQELYLGGDPQEQRIISKGNIALWTSAMLTYRITDLERWGIENREPKQLFQNDFDGMVKDVMQGKTVDELISQRQALKEEIYLILKKDPINIGGPTMESKYGVEIVSFVLRNTRFGDKLAEASEEKKRREMIAEAENYAADQEASRIRKLYTAYRDSIRDFREALGFNQQNDQVLLEFLNQQKWATAYEKNLHGQNTFVLNNTSGTPPVVLPAPSALAGGVPASGKPVGEMIGTAAPEGPSLTEALKKYPWTQRQQTTR